MRMDTMGRAARTKKRTGWKKKTAAAVLAVTIFGGTGVIFASTDAGSQLQSWFSNRVNESANFIRTSLSGHRDKQKEALKNQVNTSNPSQQIADARNAEQTTALNNIDSTKNEYIRQLDTQKQQLSQNINNQFDAVRNEVNNLTNQWIADAYNQADGLARQTISDKTSNEQGNLKNAIDAKSQEAQVELQNKINTAKNELTALLNSKQGEVEQSLKAEIDRQIEQKKKDLINLINQLVANSKADLHNKAVEQENQAKASLESIVANINK